MNLASYRLSGVKERKERKHIRKTAAAITIVARFYFILNWESRRLSLTSGRARTGAGSHVAMPDHIRQRVFFSLSLFLSCNGCDDDYTTTTIVRCTRNWTRRACLLSSVAKESSQWGRKLINPPYPLFSPLPSRSVSFHKRPHLPKPTHTVRNGWNKHRETRDAPDLGILVASRQDCK